MPNQRINRGTPFSVTATGTTTATAVTTSSTVTYYVSDISAGSIILGAGTWALYCGATGTTTLWIGAGNVNSTFQTPLEATMGTIGFFVNGTTITYANISGYYI